MSSFTAARTCFCELSSSSTRCRSWTWGVPSHDGSPMGIWFGRQERTVRPPPNTVLSGCHFRTLQPQEPVDMAHETSTFALGNSHQISPNSRLERRYDQPEICVRVRSTWTWPPSRWSPFPSGPPPLKTLMCSTVVVAISELIE